MIVFFIRALLCYIVRSFVRARVCFDSLCRFVKVYDLFEPLSDGREDKTFISKSYDATTHFESVADDVLSLYERCVCF